MNLHFIGTGAADFHPILATEQKNTVDVNIRRSTATLLDESILIDCGPHTLDALTLFSCDSKRIKHIVLTHNHSDHCNLDNIASLAQKIGEPIRFWYNELLSMPEIPGVILSPMTVGKTYDISGYAFTPLGANHCFGAVHYSIEKDEKKLFYGLDGAWLLHDTYYAMRDKKYDVMVLDATVGDYDGDYRMGEHNSIPMIRMMEKSFHTFGIAGENTKIVLDHLARTLHPTFDEVCASVAKDGYLVAYDGMKLSF